jgi:hypothetical protein
MCREVVPGPHGVSTPRAHPVRVDEIGDRWVARHYFARRRQRLASSASRHCFTGPSEYSGGPFFTRFWKCHVNAINFSLGSWTKGPGSPRRPRLSFRSTLSKRPTSATAPPVALCARNCREHMQQCVRKEVGLLDHFAQRAQAGRQHCEPPRFGSPDMPRRREEPKHHRDHQESEHITE